MKKINWDDIKPGMKIKGEDWDMFFQVASITEKSLWLFTSSLDNSYEYRRDVNNWYSDEDFSVSDIEKIVLDAIEDQKIYGGDLNLRMIFIDNELNVTELAEYIKKKLNL